MQIKKSMLVVFISTFLALSIKPVFATDDGAYIVNRSTSYVNPITGTTSDGGENIALGDSMVASIVENQVLVEQTNGKTYVTIGLGLASNVSNVRFHTMDSKGTIRATNSTVTGSSSANGDTVNHYRIQMNSLSDYISPIMYVDPMGRDVQFFITLQKSILTPGTGIYNSQMIPKASQETTVENKQTADKDAKKSAAETTKEDSTKEEATTTAETPTSVIETVDKESLFKGVEGLSTHTVSTIKDEKTKYLIIGGISLFCILLAGGMYYVKKIKK